MQVRVLIGMAVVFSLSSCGSTIKPDLHRLYMTARHDVTQPPVIVIPGIMGSRLADDWGEEVWIGNLWKVLFSDFDELALPIDRHTLSPMMDDKQVSGITDTFAGHDFYDSILRTLEDAGGFVRGEPGQPIQSGKRYYYVFAYDWRQDNVVSAAKLDQLVQQIRHDHGNEELKVDIVAHSMGGLVARYFLRYGDQDVLDDNEFPISFHGESRVRRIILLGTPSLGSVNSLHAFINGHKLGFRSIPTEVLATFPSVYQLFPHPLNDWILSSDGKTLKRDLFDIDLWRRFQWSIFDPKVRERIMDRYPNRTEGEAYLITLENYFHRYLERARRFVWSLTVKMERAPWKLVVFGGDCSLTPARVVVEEVAGESILRLSPDDISQPREQVDYDRLMLEPGDGTVTKASLLARETLDPFVPRHKYSFFPIDYPLFLCEKHDGLTNNTFFQDNLLHFLLSQDVTR